MLNIIDEKITSPVRQILGKAELLSSSAEAAYGKYVTFDNVLGKVNVNVSSKNLCQTINTYSNVTINNGVITQITADTASGWIKCTSFKNGTYVGVLGTGTKALGIQSVTFEKDDTFNQVCFGIGGIARDTLVRIDVSNLPNGTYTISGNFTNIEQGYISWEDMQIEKGSTASQYAPFTNPVGESITVGTQNLFDDNKDYGLPVLEENGEKVFTSKKYNNPNDNYREFAGFDITSIWDIASKLNTNVTISFDIKSSIAGQMQSYTLGKKKFAHINTSNRYFNCTEEWIKYHWTGIPIYSEGNEADNCQLSFYGTYGTGVVPYIKNIQIEFGDTVSNYTPYQEPTVYTIDDTLTVEALPYTPTTVIYPNNAGVFIEKAECVVCKCENTYTHRDRLQEITIDRVGEEGKFFGFGISQKLNVKVIDKDREIHPTTDNFFNIFFGTSEDSYVNNFPKFYVTETHRDENTNALSITAYDILKQMEQHTINEIDLSSYKLRELAAACGNLFGLDTEFYWQFGDENFFELEYKEGANLEGTESIRSVLNAIAEVTQTIYFVNGNKLIFKRLEKNAAAALTITKADYISLDTKDNRRLQAICATNELGNEITASISAVGTTQFIRDNPFLELREDVAEILDKAIADIGGITINQFTCSWRGNYLLEPGDKLGLITKDNETVYSYVLNDSITYNGAFSEKSQWSYTNSSETASNPTTLGEALKQTYAKVDKQNKQIDLVTQLTQDNSSKISGMAIDLDSVKTFVEDEVDGVKKTAQTFLTKDEFQVLIGEGIEGQNYSFKKDGLLFEDINPDTNNEVTTTINNKGMTIYGGNSEKLVANDEGVKAEDLHATTYLIIGKNSRFEDMGKRTACFWIGG